VKSVVYFFLYLNLRCQEPFVVTDKPVATGFPRSLTARFANRPASASERPEGRLRFRYRIRFLPQRVVFNLDELDNENP
jgi:hypothetical protein